MPDGEIRCEGREPRVVGFGFFAPRLATYAPRSKPAVVYATQRQVANIAVNAAPRELLSTSHAHSVGLLFERR